MAHKIETIFEFSLPGIILGIIELIKLGKDYDHDDEAFISMVILPTQFICSNLYIAQ